MSGEIATKPQTIEELIPETKVARILGIPQRTLYSIRKVGRIAFIQHSKATKGKATKGTSLFFRGRKGDITLFPRSSADLAGAA